MPVVLSFFRDCSQKYDLTLRKLPHAIYRFFFSTEKKKKKKKKMKILLEKQFDAFIIFAQNIHCGDTLEPPR